MKKVLTIIALLATTAGAWAEDDSTSSASTIKMFDSSGNAVTTEVDTVGTYTIDGTSRTYNAVNDTQYSCFYQVPQDSTLTLTFVNHNNANSESYKNFEVGITSNNPKASAKSYLFLRADNYGWGDSYDGPNLAASGLCRESFTEDMDSATVTVKISRPKDKDTTTVTTIAVSADKTKTMVQQFPIYVSKDSAFIRAYLTVEAAFLSDIKSTLTQGEDTATGLPAAPSYVMEENFERTTVGALNDQMGFWGSLSSEYQITKNHTLTLTFNNYNNKYGDPDCDNNFIVVLTNDVSESGRDTNAYTEYELLYASGHGTGTQYKSPLALGMDLKEFETTSTPMNGAKVTVKVAYDGDSATITTIAKSTAEEYMFQQVSIDVPEGSENIRVFLAEIQACLDSIVSSMSDSVETVSASDYGFETVDYVEGGFEREFVGTPNLNSGYWTEFSSYYQIPAEHSLDLSFINYTNHDTENTWENYIVWLGNTSSTELLWLRADLGLAGDGGGMNGGTQTTWKIVKDGVEVTKDSIPSDTTVFKAAMDSASVNIKINNVGDTAYVSIYVVSEDSSVTMTREVWVSYTDQEYIKACLSLEEAFLYDITSSLSYVRTVTAEDAYGTICLPYAATTDSATVYEVVGYSTENGTPKDLYLEEVDSMEAGKGYVFMSSKAGDIEFVLSGSKVSEAVSGALVGNLSSDTVKVDSTNYILTLDTNGNYVWGKGEDNKVGQYKAYLNLSNIQSTTTAKAGWIKMSLLTDGSDGSTGIREIATEEESAPEDDVIYNLSGMRVTNPQKGIYIKNGKKYIIK